MKEYQDTIRDHRNHQWLQTTTGGMILQVVCRGFGDTPEKKHEKNYGVSLVKKSNSQSAAPVYAVS